MYIITFYTLIIAIIFSFFIKFNPEFLNNSKKFFEKDFSEINFFFNSWKNSEKNLNQNKEKLEKNTKSKKSTNNFKTFEWRWDFYAQQNFIELAINEYNHAILEIQKVEEKNNNNQKFLEDKKKIFKKIYKNQNLIWEYKKAEKNILNIISVSSDEKFLFDLIRNKMNQKQINKAQLILNRVKNKNYKYYYFDFILNLNPNDDLEILNKKFKKVKYLTKKSWDQNYILKVNAINNAIEEFKTYKDSPKIHLYTLIAKALTNSFEFEVSNKILWEVLKIREDYRDARIIFAYNKIREWEPKKWLNILIWAESIDPSKPEIQFYKAFAYQDLWDLIKAKHNFLIALKNWYEPKSQIYQKLAEINYQEWDFWNAIDYYKKMLAENSDKIEYFLLPFDIAVEKLYDNILALKIAEWANRRHPENALSNSILWYWYFLNSKNNIWNLEKAEISLKKSFKLNPNLARNFLYIWEISMKKWQIANALKQFEIAYKKDPNWKIWEKAIRFYNELIK